MVRETRHLWVGNLPDSIREDRIRDHFKRYGRVQSVKLLGSRKEDEGGGLCATVSFMDIKSASKAHHGEHKLEDRILTTEYHEPPSIPSTNSIHYSSRYPSSEEVVGFERSHFYETGGREGRDYLSRRYHAEPAIPPRSRRQDARIYRNGPYTALISPTTERSRADHHGRSWGYESPRYTTTSVPTPQEIYPEERRESSCLHSSKKHSKSRSGSDSASTASSRSRSSSPSSRSSSCSSATSSPASDKSCSTHSQHGSLRGNAGSVNASSINSSSPAIHNEDRRPLAICVRNLPARSSDTSLKDGLYHEYKKHGKVTWVKVVGQGSERYAVVCFKKTEDVDKALQVSHDKLFFGCKIDVAPYQGYDVDDNEFSFVCRPFEADQDEFHPKATRTLFIGNLEKDITMQEIRKHFDQFGEILDIDIKKQGTTSSSYAFCQYTDIASVVRAIRSLDGEHLGSTRVKLGFGKSLHTNCVWVDGISESVSEKYLSQHFSQFGPVSHVLIDRTRGQALISFEQITYAQQAVKEMRGVMLRGRKLQIDYASRECQEAFYEHMDKQSNQHSNYDTSVSGGVTGGSVRGFETPSSSSSSSGGGSASGRYPPSSRTYPQTGQASRCHSSPSQQRSSRQRYSEYSSEYPQDRRTSYRSYEDVISVEDGEARHKERVEIEECQSSGEEGSGRRKCKHRRSDGDSSRPGTPLCDERPEPAEPRRPRERTQDPLSLPLPRFATQVLPPPSPPSSDDSQPSPPSPEWEERLRSLDEKYRKWSGSRTNPTRPDPTSVRLRHRLLALDPHDLQPSDIVKSLLAKRSVFDEDLKRLENFGEKYEPKEFVPGRVLRSPGSPVQGKGLQYPFPSHPDPSRPPTSNVSTPTTTNTSPANTNNPPSFTKPQSQPPQQVPAPVVKSKAEKTEIKKDITSSLLVSSIKPKPFRRDSEPSEARRKSREEAPEVTKSLESAVKKDDTSDCDKVKDAQVCERRKSTADKRRSSVDIKESNLVEVLDKIKECSEKKELRRASCDSIESDSKLKDPRKQIHDSVDVPTNSDADKHKKLDSEYRKDTELGSKNSGNIDIDRKKDIFGVNSEKDRRRKDSAEGSSDNLKHKKVPETNKCDSLALKTDSDETKTSDREEKRKEEMVAVKTKENKKEQVSTERERRRDSMDSDSKRPTKQDEFPKLKEVKIFNELKPPKKDSESEFNNLLNKKDSEKEVNKTKEGEKKKNCDSEISKETSLFKKVFGFTDSLRNKDNNKKPDNSMAKVETPDKQKEKKEVINESKSKKDLEMESTRHKPVSRKSPDSQEVKHKDSQEKKKNSEVGERKKKDHDITNDDFLPKDFDLNYHTKRKVIERCLNREALNINNDNDHLNKYSKEHEKKKDYYYDEFDALLESCKLKENENKHDNFAKDHKKKEYSHSDVTKNDKRINSDTHFDSEKFFDSDRKADQDRLRESKADSNSETVKFKHDKHSDRKRHQEFLENSKYKEDKKKEESHERHRKKDSADFDNVRQKEESSKNNDRKKDHFDNNKFRDMDDAVRKRKDLESLEQTKPKETSERKKDILEKERRRDRELVDAKYKDTDEKRKDGEKEKKRKDIESHEKLNGDHIDCIFDSVEEHDQKDLSNKKEKKKEHRMNSWPASIGCKRRLSSQDSDLVDDAKRSKQERRDSKDSGKSSSSSSKKGDKHGKSFSRILEERLKEDKEHDKKKEDIELTSEEKHKKQLKKEKKIEKKKEEKKFRVRLKENGTASESDLNSADEEVKNLKRQHSIFDIVDDEPAYISMYDKVKARSTKNMQKQEEEKRQEKLKEKFSQLKQSRAKREEKKRSTSYDEDSDSDHGGCGGLNRRNKLMITSSEDEGGSDCEIKLSSRTKKLTFDFSEDEGMLVTPKSRLIRSHNADHESRTRKILSDTSEDDVLRHSTPKLKTKVSIEMELKSRKIMSDTSEDDTLKCLTRIKASRIQSDESDNEVDSYNDNKEPDSNQHHTNSVSDDLYSTREFTNHNIVKTLDHNTNIRSSSPEDFGRNSLDVSEMPRKKKKQKKQKNFEDGDGSSSKKHSSKKDKKKSHSKDDEENCKKSKKKKDRDNNKREEKMEDIFGPLSDDSDKALRWHVNQVKMTEVFRVDSDSEHEIIRKKEKRRREKKARELDEAGRALEANLMMDPNETYQVVEPIKNKKKKRKKSRDEKIKHHHSESASLDQRIEEERHSFMDNFIDYTKSHQKIRQSIEKELKISEKEEEDYVSEEFTKENRIDEDSQQRMEEEAIESILPHNSDSEDASSKVRPKSMSSLLDSPPPAAQQTQQQQQHSHQPKKIDIPGFRGLDVDEDIHETAVKSISESSSNSIQINEPKFEPEKTEQTSNDEKPTPVISQEETEDAVAALLMEDPFNGTSGDFESYTEDTPKPDTPASEPDLQIDTDAEETYDIDISKPPRTPDIPQSFYRQVDTREGLEERILPLVCTSDTPIKEEIKVLEVPRTPGSGLERKAEEDQPADIQPIKLNLDSPEKQIKEELETSDSQVCETETNEDIKNSSYETKKEIDEPMDTKETPIVPQESTDSIDDKPCEKQESSDAIFDSLVRGSIINDSAKKELVKPPADSTPSNPLNSFVTKVTTSPQLPEPKHLAELEPIVIKQNPASVVTQVSKEVENPNVVSGDTAPKTSTIINKLIPSTPTPTQVTAAIQQSNIATPEAKSDMDVIRVNVGGVNQSCIKSPTRIVQVAPSSPCIARPQLHFPSTVNSVSSPLGLVRTSTIQTHPITPQTRPASPQVHHLTVIPNQQVRSPSSPLMVQHGLNPKPGSQVIQQPSTGNPVIRHTVSSNVQPVKPASTIVVSQPNIQRQLQIVTQPSHLSPPNIKLVRTEQPSNPLNIVRLVRPVMPNQCLPVRQSVPLLQPISTGDIRSSIPMHDVKEPPSLIALQDKPIIQHTVSHISTPVNVIKNPSTENPKVLDQNREVKISHTFDRDSVPELKELTPPFPVGMDLPKDLIKQPTSFKHILNNEENSTSNDGQNYVLDDTKPLNAVIHDLASKLNSKHPDESESNKKINEIESDLSKEHNVEAPSGMDSETEVHASVKKPELVLSEDIISIKTDDSQDYEINKPELLGIKDDTINDVEELKSDGSNLNTKEEDLPKVDSPKVNLEEKIQEEKTPEEKEEPKKAEEPKVDESNLDKDVDNSKNIKNHTDHPPEIEDLEKDEEPLSPMEVQEEAPIEKTVIVKESGGTWRGRRRKRKVRLGPVRRAKNTPATPVKTSTDIYEFRDDSEEERPRLILTIKSPPDRSEPIKIKATPTTRKSRRLQEKDGGGNCRKAPVVEHTVEGPVIKTSNRPGRRATRSTQPNLTVTLNPEPRKSPRRKHAQHVQPAPAPVEEKALRIESPPTPPPTPAAAVPPSVLAAPPSVLATPVVIPVSRPSTPLSTPAVPPTPPSSATPPASSTPPVSNPTPVSTPTPVLPTPSVSSPPPPPPATTITTVSSVVVSTPLPTPSTSSPTVVTSTPPVSAASTIVSVPVTSSTPPTLISTPLKVISKPTPTLVPHPVQTIQGSIPVNVSIAPNNNALQNRNSLEPTTLIDPVTGLLIPMQESEEGQYIPLHSDLNRAEGEPAKKRLRIHAEVTRPSVVRQVLPPSTTVLTHNVQPQVCHPQQHQVVQPTVSQNHQVVQPPVSQQHQVVQPPVSQHHQVVQPPVSQHHQVVQPPVTQHHQVVQTPVSQHHQVVQPPVSQHHQVVQPPVSQHHQVVQPPVSQHHQVVQPMVSQHHQVVQPPVSQHHQVVQSQMSQHHHLQHSHLQTNQPHISQHQSHPPQHPVHQSQVSLHQLQVAHHAPSQHPMSQHQPPQHSMSHQPPQHHPPQSHTNAHQCQPPKPLHHHQSLATVTPVLVSHQPPPLMPVTSPHHPSAGHHIQPSVQIQSITKPGPVSKSHSNIPLATVTVSTPKMLVSKSEPSIVKGLYPPHSIDSPSMAHPSVLHSVPSTTCAVHISGIPSVVHTTSSGHGVHGSVLQSGVSMGGVVNQRSMGAVHPAPAHSPALNPAPAHSPALHPTPAHSPVHPTPAHHPLIVRTVPHGLNPPAAHMQHAHAIHTPSHADSHRAVPSPAPGAPPGLPVACKPAPITPKAHLLQAVRPRASPSTVHPPPPKAHIHTPITNIRDGSLASTAGPLGGPSINSPPPRAAHQQPPTHLHNPPTSSPRVVIKSQIGSMERARETCLSVTSPQPRPSHVQPGLPMSASYEPSMHVDGIMGSSSHWGSQRSRQTPPPAHQHSSQGDVVQHFVNAHMQPAHYVPSQLVYPQWMGNNANNANNNRGDRSKDSGTNSPPLELRRQQTSPRPPYYETPPPAHSRPSLPRPHTPPHASQVPPQADSLITLLRRHPVMWQGLLALKNDQAAVQMHFVFGNMYVARDSLPCNRDGSTPPLRIAQRMRLEQAQIDGVSRKMQSDNEHCMLLALPCGRDHMDVLQQSNNLQSCFITYLQQKQAAGIVNIAVSGSQQPAYVIHIFPSCEFANESLARIAPDLMHRVADIAHLLIVIATV